MPSLRKLVLAALTVAAMPVGRAAAQDPKAPSPAEQPTPPASPTPATEPAAPPAEAAPAAPAATEAPKAEPVKAPAPPPTPTQMPTPERKTRWKPLQVSVGLAPTAQDLGSEADILGVSSAQDLGVILDQWAMTLKGGIL